MDGDNKKDKNLSETLFFWSKFQNIIKWEKGSAIKVDFNVQFWSGLYKHFENDIILNLNKRTIYNIHLKPIKTINYKRL